MNSSKKKKKWTKIEQKKKASATWRQHQSWVNCVMVMTSLSWYGNCTTAFWSQT